MHSQNEYFPFQKNCKFISSIRVTKALGILRITCDTQVKSHENKMGLRNLFESPRTFIIF